MAKNKSTTTTTTTTQAPVEDKQTELEKVAGEVVQDLQDGLEKVEADPETKDVVLNIEADQTKVAELADKTDELMASPTPVGDTFVQETKEEPAKVDIEADGLQLSVFENRVAFLKEKGTNEEKYVVAVLENYVSVCSTSIDKNKIGVEQQRLWRLFEYIHNKPQQFKSLFQIVIEFGRQYKTSVFEISKFYRAQEALTLNQDQLAAYNGIRQLILETISTKNRADVKRLVDIRKIVSYDCVPEHIRGFYVAFYEA